MKKNLFLFFALALCAVSFTNCDDKTDSTVNITAVTLNKETLSLVVGATETLTAGIVPVTATNKKVTWLSSTPVIATVDATGKVMAVAAGTATITVTTEDGAKTATCVVTVTATPVPVTSVKFAKGASALIVASDTTLTVTIEPEGATNRVITWTSSKPEIATVVDGKVTGIAVGVTIITAKTVDGDKTATYRVTVIPEKNWATNGDLSYYDPAQPTVLSGWVTTPALVATETADNWYVVPTDTNTYFLKTSGTSVKRSVTITRTLAQATTPGGYKATIKYKASAYNVFITAPDFFFAPLPVTPVGNGYGIAPLSEAQKALNSVTTYDPDTTHIIEKRFITNGGNMSITFSIDAFPSAGLTETSPAFFEIYSITLEKYDK